MKHELETKYSGRNEAKTHWSTEYIDDLSRNGWRFTNGKEGGINSKFISFHDEQTPSLLNEWQKSGDPIEMSIVTVSPNDEMEALPARSLGYAAAALSLSDSLIKNNVNVSKLRIISPCKINAYANGGNRDQQILNAERFQKLVETYKNQYLPSLSNIEVTLDTGLPLTQNTIDLLIPKAEQILSDHPRIGESLTNASLKYKNGSPEREENGNKVSPLIYLLAHPDAWGYGDDNILFAPNGQRRINFAPTSELRYLHAMKLTEGIWTPSKGKEIATIISGKNTHAPYYNLLSNEPTLRDLSNPENTPNTLVNNLRKQSGRTEIAETIDNLNLIKTHQEQEAKRRKLNRLEAPMTLDKLISSL